LRPSISVDTAVCAAARSSTRAAARVLDRDEPRRNDAGCDARAVALSGDAVVDARGLRLARGQDADDAVRAIIATVFAQNPVQVEQVRAGKDKVKGFLVGQVLKAAGKGVDPKVAQRLVDVALTEGD
jgi:hypothetical protein